MKSVHGTKFRDLDGKYISEVGKLWPGEKKIAIITAWNPNFKKAPAIQNKRANAKLKKVLETGGEQFQRINGWWPDESAFEESFVVEGMTHGVARELCRTFQQVGYFYAKRNEEIQLTLL